ncbi:alpha-amylase family glycosyl hydrolase [Ferruginibacter sp.]|uniref:alpha-amylase family glycosyl hydrolase n=1 Tax=Ferruginibacter sp. TaxID=1940288 RepID=UPI00265A0138|nr:alpha-amylase family glycosyl hydrolase [Ferruginibacter sp.]
MKNISCFFVLQLLLFVVGNSQQKTTTKTSKANHPAWIMQGNIYEVNVRQYTPEGTFNAFAKHLNRLKNMGVQTLWFMPLNPISKVDRKGTLGSYYAVSDYTSINPEFGTIRDWKQLVKTIHAKGMKVIIDWVPNHTGGDHHWLKEQPDFFVKDANGNAAVAVDWADTRQLDYKNPVMQDSMITCMKYWLNKTGIDGFRCDVAWNVPGSFWSKCIGQLKQINPAIFMLAEGDRPYLSRNGFDAVYPWDMFHMMIKVAAGERPAFALDSVRTYDDTAFAAKEIQMYFTSNHDENSWNKADYGVFPGASHAPFAVFTQTMVNSVPLIYSGQEEPVLKPLEFFEKDPISFNKFQRADFYKTLLNLRKINPALAADASFKKINAGDDKSLYAFTREKSGNKVLVILNLTATQQAVTVTDKKLWGKPYNVFMGNTEILNGRQWMIEPWGYVVYTYTKK